MAEVGSIAPLRVEIKVGDSTVITGNLDVPTRTKLSAGGTVTIETSIDEIRSELSTFLANAGLAVALDRRPTEHLCSECPSNTAETLR